LGRLFAYGGLARSGRLKEEWTSDKNTPYIKEFTSLVINLALKKEYLREPSVSVLLSLLEMVTTCFHILKRLIPAYNIPFLPVVNAMLCDDFVGPCMMCFIWFILID